MKRLRSPAIEAARLPAIEAGQQALEGANEFLGPLDLGHVTGGGDQLERNAVEPLSQRSQ
jgi:hypothetical protein